MDAVCTCPRFEMTVPELEAERGVAAFLGALFIYRRCAWSMSISARSETEMALRALGSSAFEALFRTDRGRDNDLTPREKNGLTWLRFQEDMHGGPRTVGPLG